LDILCLIRKQVEKGQKETICVVNMPNFTSLLLFYLTTFIKNETLAFNETLKISVEVIKNGTPQILAKVFDQKFLIGLTEALGSHAGDFALMGILNLIHHWFSFGEIHQAGMNLLPHQWEECGGLDILDRLQLHDSENVYEKVVLLLKTYFADSCEE